MMNPSQFNLSTLWHTLQPACSGKDAYTSECLIRYFCPQYSSWVLRVGVILIVSYMAHEWLLKALWLGLEATDEEKRLIRAEVKDVLLMLFVAFVGVVVWTHLS